MLDVKDTPEGAVLSVRVLPRSSRNELAGETGGALKVKLTAPPVEGAANKGLIKLLASVFKVPKSSVEIISGETSKNKKVRILGVKAADVLKAAG